jgi:hypothetical protein
LNTHKSTRWIEAAFARSTNWRRKLETKCKYGTQRQASDAGVRAKLDAIAHYSTIIHEKSDAGHIIKQELDPFKATSK